MSENEGFRDELRAVIRKHDPSPDELRDAADGIKELASRWEDTEDLL